MIKKTIIQLACLFVLTLMSAFGQKQQDVSAQQNDTSAKAKQNKEYLKITSGAAISKGMFKIIRTKQDIYYFEIPDSLLGRDMLFGSRVSDISDNSKISAGQRRSNPILISFSRNDKVVMLHRPTGTSIAKANDPISVALDRNNRIPVAMTFDIAARNNDDDASVIEVSRVFLSEVDMVFPAGAGNTGRPDPKLGYIREMKTFPHNVEVKSHYNYAGTREPFSITINYSIVLLPATPMQARINDERIGYSSENKRIFESGKPHTGIQYIDRWRIEPRKEDVMLHQQGKPVKPQQQIVFYVDTIMPEKWRKYVRMGIEDWNAAFEKIGFKEVIKAIDYPRDPDFDPDDSRYNCFRYIVSTDANAQGPQWIDPRTGEIVQGDILWWHNVTDLLQTWRFVQTAAADPGARMKTLNDEIMGDAIRYAVAHEMGHVLGLQHNMRASFAYPTDSLRSATFTQQYGTTASIMDYARNNYIAQPGDKEKGVRMTPPVLGPYDYFAIMWGYKPIYDASGPEDELKTLNQWFLDLANDPMYLFAPTTVSPVIPDPSAQSDALGNDLIKSAAYAQSNMKFITNNLIGWTMKEGDDFALLRKRFEAVSKLYFRVTNLTLSYLGGVYVMYGTYGQHTQRLVPVEKEKQQQTVNFTVCSLLDTDWLNNPDIVRQLGSSTEEITKWQTSTLSQMLGNFILGRIIQNEALNQDNAYTLREYLSDLDQAIWQTTNSNEQSIFSNHIQLTYIERLCSLVKPIANPVDKQDARSGNENIQASIASSQLLKTKETILKTMVCKPELRGHYLLMINMIDKTLKID
jgi:hypothetical protein